MKLSVSTLGCTEKNIEDIAALCHECGIYGIEVRGIGGVMDIRRLACLEPDNFPKVKAMLEAHGAGIIGLGTSCSFHDPQKFDVSLDEGMEAIKCAKRIGAGFIRVFGNKLYSDGLTSTAERIVTGIDTLCGYSPDVDVLLEVHGDFNCEKTLSPVLEGMKHRKNFGVIWDVMHSDRYYGDDIGGFYDFIYPYVKHVHLKDCLRGEQIKLVLMGRGNIPIREIVGRLLSDGYDGFFSFEWERKWHPELCDADISFRDFAEYMRSNFSLKEDR